MVAKMMRWPWPPAARKFRAKLVVGKVVGLKNLRDLPELELEDKNNEDQKVVVEVRWKGTKATGLGSLRRAVRRNRTREEEVKRSDNGDGLVVWEEEFESAVTLTRSTGGGFCAWEVEFTVFNDLIKAPKNKASILGTASLNLAEYASAAEGEIEVTLPLSVSGVAAESASSLHLTLSLLELRLPQESQEASQRSAVTAPLSPYSGDSSGKDEVSVIKAGLRKVKILTDLVSTRKSKKTSQDDEGSDEKCYVHSDSAEYPCDTDSFDGDLYDREPEDDKVDSGVRKSFSYGSLQSVNYVGGLFYSSARIDGHHEDWVYYSHWRSDAGYPHVEEPALSVVEEPVLQPPKRSILPWKKRKLSLRSLKNKGEPLLKKAYGEEGGDDIDYDRRILSSSDESVSAEGKNEDGSVKSLLVSEFGDDNFVVGNWESKEVLSRDGCMKLSTQVFFASIDQRSERAAGESACTALVAVIADWFQKNKATMPIRSQFDSLIHEGSREWRNLCNNETYRERFPDKHFDLETVINAKIRPLEVVPSKSFIGFFQPEGNDDNSGFDFLDGAMSFDSIWDEISPVGSSCSTVKNPNLYIVSWNDHFFLLKVEPDAYYIIDTLGERLYEGCSQAYILKFDENTLIHQITSEMKSVNAESGSGSVKDTPENSSADEDDTKDAGNKDGELVSKGKEACKEYIKSFLAAIPIRELQADIKKGLLASTPLHHRLQIEFHYTESLQEEIIAMHSPEPALELSWPAPPTLEVTAAPAVAVA